MPKFALVMDVPDDVKPEVLKEAVRECLFCELGDYEVEGEVVFGGDVEAQVIDSLTIAEQ